MAGFFGQWGSVLLWIPPSQQTTIWLPGGLLLAILLITEKHLWPFLLSATAAGQATLFMLLGVASPPQALLLAAEFMVIVSVTALVLNRAIGQPIGFGTFREFVVYLGVTVVAGALYASAIFMAGAWFASYRPVSFLVWRTFTLSVVLGYLMVTPTAVLLIRNIERILSDTLARRLEGLLLILLMTLASAIVFGGAARREYFWPVFAIVIPPLLFWAALRFGALGAAGSLLLVTVISTFGTARGLGPFNFESAADNTLSLQLFMLGTALPLFGLAVILGEQQRTVGVLRETHTRLRDLNRDLLNARESEAGRIARELHDDIGQRLALVSIGLSHLRKLAGPTADGSLGEISKLQEQASAISRSVRELSHELHPTALQHTGLTVALQMACEEVARVTGLDVRLTADGETADLPPDIALGLFRVTQEALNNAVRHAGATSIRVSLQRREDGVMLVIADDGKGFVPGSARGRSGLGLHSMIQRLSHVGGAVTIDSSPGGGTKVRAQVPLQGGTIA
jgi:two-component system sensor histidine kinase UhpB